MRRGLQNMRIQAFLTAAVVNLKRLAFALYAFSGLSPPLSYCSTIIPISPPPDPQPLSAFGTNWFFNGPTRQRCQLALRTLATVALMPSWASETTA